MDRSHHLKNLPATKTKCMIRQAEAKPENHQNLTGKILDDREKHM